LHRREIYSGREGAAGGSPPAAPSRVGSWRKNTRGIRAEVGEEHRGRWRSRHDQGPTRWYAGSDVLPINHSSGDNQVCFWLVLVKIVATEVIKAFAARTIEALSIRLRRRKDDPKRYLLHRPNGQTTAHIGYHDSPMPYNVPESGSGDMSAMRCLSGSGISPDCSSRGG
jgi:hypothetical protein